MAEVVEEMQERLLPEYEQMQKFQVCSDDQLRECIRKRNSFQTRITKRTKSMNDYLEFIIFERKVHKWVCEKEEVLGRKLSGLKASIAKRIIRLYREGLQRFPHEERLWQNFLQFSKKSVPHEVTSIYERMLTLYGDREKLWCDTAIWVYQYSGNMPKVKEIFYRALQRHPDSEVINKSFFDLLLASAIAMSDEQNLDNNTKSEQDIGMEFVQLAYLNSRKCVKNINFYISLLERCEESEYATKTIKLQKKIVEDMMETYSKEELMWDALAQRELRGFSTSDIKKGAVDDDTNDLKLIWLQRTMKQKIELCCKIYETAVEALPTEKMWTLYINAMLKLNQEMEEELPLKRRRLALAFKSGEKTCLISDDHLDIYIRMLLATPNGVEPAKDVLERLSPHRSTLKFYELWLSPYIVEENESKIDEICEKAFKTFGNSSIPIWRRVIQFYKFKKNFKRLEEILKCMAFQPKADFSDFRSEYLEHTMATSKMEEVRRVYKELLQIPPPCLKIQQKMIEIEAETNPKDIKRLRLYHENIVQFFGATHPEVWLNFVKFERNQGDPKNLPMLCSRAKSVLKPYLVETFVSEYALFSLGD